MLLTTRQIVVCRRLLDYCKPRINDTCRTHPCRNTNTLPVELHSTILNFVLQDEKRALWLACALTCRHWLNHIAPRLFDTAYILNRADVDSLLQLPRQYARSLLFCHLRYLFLDEKLRLDPCLNASYPIPLMEKFSRAFPLLVGVHCRADVVNSFWSSQPLNSQERAALLSSVGRGSIATKSCYKQFGNHLPALCELSLSNYTFHSLVDLIRICGSLPLLKYLDLSSVFWNIVPKSISSLRRMRHQLRRVRVSRCVHIGHLFWLWACYADTLSQGLIHGGDLYTAGLAADLAPFTDRGEGTLVCVNSLKCAQDCHSQCSLSLIFGTLFTLNSL